MQYFSTLPKIVYFDIETAFNGSYLNSEMNIVSGEGGLSLGIPSPVTPVAVPGCIYTVGTINSAVAVNAPVGNFGIANCGIMDAVLMTDVLNSKIYDTHIHPAPRGVTGPPATPFIGV